MRAVARQAGVSLGLVNYHFEDKTSLIAAALHRVEEQDLAMVKPDLALPPEEFKQIDTRAQGRYRAGIARLIREARPELSRPECNRRAADIDVVQNGIWLTALLGLDRASVRRSIIRCEEIALRD